MTGERVDGKQRRAESRERRRAQAGRSEPQPAAGQADGGEALQAARAAATAAAVGAAVGAVRALTGRRDEGPPEGDLSEREQTSGADDAPPEQAPAEPDGAAEPPSGGGAEQPPPAATSEARPAHGASPDETARVVRRALEHLRDLHGSEPESVSALEHTADGWLVTFEVVELHRVPDSTDLLATYHVELDPDGGLLGFRRGGRYYRAQADAREGQT